MRNAANKTNLNLMPHTGHAPTYIKHRVIAWAFAWLAIAGVSWLTISAENSKVRLSTGDLQILQQKILPVSHFRTQITKLNNELNDARHQCETELKLADQNPILTLMSTIANAAKEDGKVCVTNLLLEQTPGSPDSRQRLTLKGVGTDNIAIAKFTSKLDASQRFNRVQLKSTVEAKIENKTARRYEIECGF